MTEFFTNKRGINDLTCSNSTVYRVLNILPADRARSMPNEPFVYTGHVKHVMTLRQAPSNFSLLKILIKNRRERHKHIKYSAIIKERKPAAHIH